MGKFIYMAWFFLALAVSAHAERGQLSVLQGASDLTSAQLTVVHQKSEPLKFAAQVGETMYAPTATKTTGQDFSEWVVTGVRFGDLPPGFSAKLLVTSPDGRVVDERPFHGLDLQPRKARIALVSCAAGYLYYSEIWQRLNDSNPDLVLFLGDNIYGDRPNIVTKKPADPKQLWELYINARRHYDFYFRKTLVPAIATWDDHDFGTDNGNSEFRYAAESQDMFTTFFAQSAAANLNPGPGVSSAFTAFGMDFALLDSRRFRSAATGPGATGWGQEQLRWLNRTLNKSERPMWIANGENFFAGYDGHSSNILFPGEFEQLVAMVRGSQRLIGFISGDVHFSEISDIEPAILGFPTVEITSSAIHALTVPGLDRTWPNRRRRVANSQHNFTLVDVEVTAESMMGTVTSVLRDGKPAYQEPISIHR